MSKTVSGGHGINIHIHIVSLNVFQWLRYILQTELDTQRNKDNTENSIERQNVGKAKKARLPRCLVLPSVSEWENKFKGRYWGSGLGGLEISIQHQIVNALELSITAPIPNPTPTPLPHPPPHPQKSGSPTVKSFTCGCFVDTVRLPCALRFGSVAFPVLLPIDIENPHHYWKVVYRIRRFLRLSNS